MVLTYGWQVIVLFAANVLADVVIGGPGYGGDDPQLILQQQRSNLKNASVLATVDGKVPILSTDFLTFVEELRQNTSIPGISLGVVRLAGESEEPITQFAAFGRKLEDGDGHDLTSDTLFCLASCSKAFLSASLGLLIDDFAHGRNATPLPAGLSRFDWDTKIAALLPEEWQLDDRRSTLAANVRDVLGHVSGLPRHDGAYRPGDTTGDVVRRMRVLRTAYELREKYSYNNQMYMLGAHIIETYSGLPYQDFVAERVFKPLNMSTSTLWPSEATSSGLFTDTWTKDGRRIPFWFTDEISQVNAGPGGVISSAEDMVKWLAVLLNHGVHPVSGETIIPRSVYDATTTARHVVHGRPTEPYGSIVGYGMGWNRWTFKGQDMIMHTGGIPGFSTIAVFSPSSNLGVVILTNADEKAEQNFVIAKRAFDEVLELPHADTGIASPNPARIPPQAHLEAAAYVHSGMLLQDLEAYTGTYSAPGYGAITLCSAQSTSHYCHEVLQDFASLRPLPISEPHLYGAYKTMWSTHVRLSHSAGVVFHATFPALFPHGYGKNTSAFGTYETGSDAWVEFAVVDGKVEGFSLVVDEEAVTARRRRRGGTLKDVADAWFEKI
ncbi:beta-lactamase/transpeptidase-like protein [Cubamyces menziesii]|nr:beta-lactamase/transpeptidase-like protein [Cubamyces menziesii]